MDAVTSAYKNKLKNKLFALLCEREKSLLKIKCTRDLINSVLNF